MGDQRTCEALISYLPRQLIIHRCTATQTKEHPCALTSGSRPDNRKHRMRSYRDSFTGMSNATVFTIPWRWNCSHTLYKPARGKIMLNGEVFESI